MIYHLVRTEVFVPTKEARSRASVQLVSLEQPAKKVDKSFLFYYTYVNYFHNYLDYGFKDYMFRILK